MIPGWLKSFVGWLVGLFVHEAVEQVKETINQPKTIENANTPPDVKSAVDADIAAKLRERTQGGSR